MPEDQKPGMKQARGMLNEYKKTWAKRTTVRKAPPITDELLRAMAATCDLRGAATDACSSLAGGPQLQDPGRRSVHRRRRGRRRLRHPWTSGPP